MENRPSKYSQIHFSDRAKHVNVRYTFDTSSSNLTRKLIARQTQIVRTTHDGRNSLNTVWSEQFSKIFDRFHIFAIESLSYLHRWDNVTDSALSRRIFNAKKLAIWPVCRAYLPATTYGRPGLETEINDFRCFGFFSISNFVTGIIFFSILFTISRRYRYFIFSISIIDTDIFSVFTGIRYRFQALD